MRRAEKHRFSEHGSLKHSSHIIARGGASSAHSRRFKSTGAARTHKSKLILDPLIARVRLAPMAEAHSRRPVN